MPKRGKKYREAVASYDKTALFEVPEAMKHVVKLQKQNSMKQSKYTSSLVLTEDTLTSRLEALLFFLTEQANQRRFWFSQRDLRQLRLRQQVLIM